ncbi:MAG: response regulator transcription factor, partial [Deltaproteobacteria bacterium]|nr:response regulator transcription factor [Deltaproteobacteria bacterium]
RSTVMLAEPVQAKADDLYLIQELKRTVDGVFRLTSTADDTREIALEKDFTTENRKFSWVYFIQKGVGIQAVESDRGVAASDDFDPSNPTHSRRILLVSDDPAEVEVLRAGLEPIFTLEIARSETEAMTQLLQPRFGLIIVAFVDDERGQAFCRYVRTQRIKHPVVLVGNQKRRAWERASILLQGVDDFIARPYSQVELISRISSILRRASFGFPFEEVAEYIGAQKRLWQKLKKFTKEDPDTGLTTLKFFNAALEHELFKAKMVGYPCALVAATVGANGDTKDEFTDFLRQMVRDTDLVTLLPSGEYMIFLGANGPTEVDLFLKRLSKGSRERFTSTPMPVRYAIANYPKDATDGDTLIRVAANRVVEAPTPLA